jgi:signal transduction histidine kinase
LSEALEQQTATSDILKVISRSQTDLRSVFDTIADSALSLCDGLFSIVVRYDGETIHLVALANVDREAGEAVRRQFPYRPSRASAGARAILDRHVVYIPDIREDPEYQRRNVAEAANYRSVVSVPMLRDIEPIGAITVCGARIGAFSPKQIALLQTFADQAVIAIENVRLFTEVQEKNRALTESLEQQTATGEILQVISSSRTDVQPVLDVMARSAAQLCAADDAGIFRLEGDALYLMAHHGPLESRQVLSVTRETLGGRSVLERTVVQVADMQAETGEFPGASQVATALGFRTLLSVPLLREGMAIGVIQLRRRKVQPFSETQTELIRTFADQAVIAIENVRLFTELQVKNRELTDAHAQVTEALDQQTATSEILGVISQSPTDVQPVFDTIVRNGMRLTGAARCVLFGFDGEMLRVLAMHNVRPEGIDMIHRIFPSPASRHSAMGRAVLDRTIAHIPNVTLDPEFGFHDAARAVDFRAVLAVPILREDVAIGAIVAQRSEPGTFSESQVQLLKTFADQAVIAIENVRLFKQLEARNRDLTEALDRQTATAEILRVISQSQTEVQPVFEAIVDNALRLFRAWSASVLRVEGQLIYLIAMRGGLPGSEAYMRREQSPRSIYSMTPAARCIETRSVVHIQDVESDPTLDQQIRDMARTRGWKSELLAPMLREGQPIGVIAITRAEAGAFSAAEIQLLQTFADQAVIAVENARLLTELQARTTDLTRSVGQLTALGEVGQAVSSSLDLETVLTTIVSRAVQLSGLDGGVIFEYDEATEEFVQRAAIEQTGALAEARRTIPIRKGEGVVGRTAVTLEPAQVPDITVAGAYEGRLRETLIASGVRAVLAVPMVREGHLIGCLAVTRNRSGDFPSEMIELLRTFATQSSLAIQNARLFLEIADKSRQLEAASQHKSEFLANMSHELRTPLNAIIGFSEVLSERMFGELNEKQEEYSKDIHASGQHLLSLINDILDLSKIEAGRMELELSDFDLPTALDSALTLVRERAGRRGIALQMNVDERLGQIQADERKVRQVVLNLLSNAIKFTPEGGRIEVAAVPRDGFVEVSVSDTGVGIAPEDHEAVFQEFRQVGTADKKVEGTGLGLTLCRKFVELHGGRIWVKSQVGVGSTFTFTIPVPRRE